MKLNILIVGVGGQGALTTAHLIARAAVKAGLNAITAETHGMAQRGGSVEVHIRIGEVLSPLIPEGSADIVLALEPVEALRYAKYIGKNTSIILNSRKLVPPSVTIGLGRYPGFEEILENLRKIAKVVYVVPASELALKIGDVVATNVVVVGVLLSLFEMPFRIEHVEEVIKETMKNSEMNLKALKMGYNFKSNQLSAV
ncbi:MAG: indolepyruvate oxidoreductase subunit beta [Archaeoglobaceae archaeon]|nr:indolepyruvate oxidoreductase subunit beta [Archaeoglobaceae archaeon]MDW7989590.1 indolepyruvate oxidoreductase subunit beta [Archaeoglobaceae archaeon]